MRTASTFQFTVGVSGISDHMGVFILGHGTFDYEAQPDIIL